MDAKYVYIHGSSPHTWGTRSGPGSLLVKSRFIPTHVGNTKLYRLATGAWAVHPHTRGEHRHGVWHTHSRNGSSPHTWGTHDVLGQALNQYRFIPTHVGNTEISHFCWVVVPVHPHTRGEHSIATLTPVPASGSSPHTWGTQALGDDRWSKFRFIPTHVGNTRLARCAPSASTVHPHTRGEHIVPPKPEFALFGSSPHTWGTP